MWNDVGDVVDGEEMRMIYTRIGHPVATLLLRRNK